MSRYEEGIDCAALAKTLVVSAKVDARSAPWRWNTMEDLFLHEVLPVYNATTLSTVMTLEERSVIWKHLRNMLPDLIIELKIMEKQQEGVSDAIIEQRK